MRILQLANLKRGGKVRQLRVATWPEGNVIAVEVGGDKGARSVRWLMLDGTQLRHRDLPTRGGPNAALSADLHMLAYVLRDRTGDTIVLEKTDEPNRPPVLLRLSEPDEGEEEEKLTYLALGIQAGNKSLRATSSVGCFVGWEIARAFKNKKPRPIFCSVYTGDQLGIVTEVMGFLPDGGTILGMDRGNCWFLDKKGDTTGWIWTDEKKNQGPVRCLALSPDGCILLMGIDDTVEGWLLEGDIHMVRKIGLRGHKRPVTALAYSPEGKMIATADEAGVVRFWEGGRGELRKTWDWKVGRIGALAFSPDGFTCVAGAARGRIVVWDLDD
jgi:WD40 repeat protein